MTTWGPHIYEFQISTHASKEINQKGGKIRKSSRLLSNHQIVKSTSLLWLIWAIVHLKGYLLIKFHWDIFFRDSCRPSCAQISYRDSFRTQKNILPIFLVWPNFTHCVSGFLSSGKKPEKRDKGSYCTAVLKDSRARAPGHLCSADEKHLYSMLPFWYILVHLICLFSNPLSVFDKPLSVNRGYPPFPLRKFKLTFGENLFH